MKNILVLDSGVGGLNVLHECVKICPFFNYLYFGDQKNMPYGNKSKAYLKKHAICLLNDIKKFYDFDTVIVACNTLTSCAISEIRKTFKNITVIGTEPAIKPALSKYKPDEILIVATFATITQNKLIKKAKSLKVSIFPLNSLAKLIEESSDQIVPYLKSKIAPSYKAIVLGCTHYEFIEKEICELFNVECFSASKGVAKRLKYLYEKSLTKISPQEKVLSLNVQMMSSGTQEDLYKLIAFYERLEFSKL